MISSSEAFNAVINGYSRAFRCRFLTNGEPLSCEIKKIKIVKGACGSEYSPGSVFIPYIEAELANCSASLKGKNLELQTGVMLGYDISGAEEVEYIPVGSFTVDDCRKTTSGLTLSAVGRITSKCSGIYESSLAFPATIQAVANEIAAQTGVPIVFRGLNISGLFLTVKPEGLFYKEVLGYIAGALGGYATEDNNGNIVITKFSTQSVIPVNGDRSLSLPEFTESDFEIAGIKVIVTDDVQDEEGNAVEGVSFSFGDGSLVLRNPFMTEELFEVMKQNLQGVIYRPGKLDISLGEPRLEPWDCLQVEDLNGTKYNLPCLNITHTYDGGFSSEIVSPGENDPGSNYAPKGPMAQQLERIHTLLLTANEAIFKRIKADEAEILYAKITELDAVKAQIEKITASEITTEYLEANYAKLSSFSALEGTVNKLSVDALTADKADIRYANLGEFNAIKGRVGTLEADKITVTQLDARYAKIAELEAVNGRFGTISADKTVTEYLVANYAALTDFKALKGTVESLDANKITTDYLNANYASLSSLNSAVAEIGTLKSNKVDVNKANIDEAWIKDLLVKGKFLVSDINAATGSFSHYLTGVNIIGDNITAGTITTERLVIRDAESDTGILYELNNGAVNQSGLTPEELKRLTLNGKVITAESITADKINVTDLFAQNIMATGSITGASLHAALLETDIGHIGAFNIDNFGLQSQSTGLVANYDWSSPHSLQFAPARIRDYETAVYTYPIDSNLFSRCRYKATVSEFKNVPSTAKLQCGPNSYITNVTNLKLKLVCICDGVGFSETPVSTTWGELLLIKPSSKQVEFGWEILATGKRVTGAQQLLVTDNPIYWMADGNVGGVTNEDYTLKLIATTFKPQLELYAIPANVGIYPHELRYGDFRVNSLGDAFGVTPKTADVSNLLATTEFVRNAMTWGYLNDKPTSFPPAAHDHNGLYSALNHTHDDRYYTETEINSKLSGYSATGHTHDDRYFTETEINSKLGGYSASGHLHDDRYYTESEIDTKLNGKQNNLGFTPIQQGGGTDQKSNKIYIGWTNSKLNVQVDVTNFGAIALESWVSGNYSALGHKHAAGDITSGTLGVGRGGTGQTEASKTFSCGAVNTGNVTLLEQDCYFFPYTNQGHVRAAVRVHDLAIAAHEIFSVLQMPSAYCPSKDCAVTVTVMGNGAANGIYIASTRLIRVKCQNALTATTTRDYYIDFHFTR